MVPADPSCECLDYDTDGDIDMLDFARFQVVFAWNMCQIANPSFELPGQRGNAFGGWYQVRDVSASAELVSHGAVAAKVTGSLDEPWAVSAVWQRLDASPDDQWEALVCVAHSSASPLTGGSQAILNVEWYSADGPNGYESHAIADASTPTDVMATAVAQIGPAPEGTETLRLVLGVLQDPDETPAIVFFDLVEFNPQDLDERQWEDFDTGRTIEFSGRSWRVKGCVDATCDPGDSYYGHTEDHLWVDWMGENDRLHLTVRLLEGNLYSTEVAIEEPLGYGDYIVTTVGPLDTWEPHVVLGTFLYQYTPCWRPQDMWWNPNNEIDIEISHWGNPNDANVGQFAVQPHDFDDEHRVRFPIVAGQGELTSHAFRWLPDRVEFRCWHGGPDDECPETVIYEWTYPPPGQLPLHVARPEQPRMHINFWRRRDPMGPPVPWSDHEIVIDDFRFVPSTFGRCSAGGT